MDFVLFATVVLAIYFVLWFFDSFFKSCMHYPYEAFLNGTGLTIKPFRIQWYTTALNRITIKWAHTYPKLFKCSFDAGVFASICLLPLMLLWQMKPYIEDAISSHGLNAIANAPSSIDGARAKQDGTVGSAGSGSGNGATTTNNNNNGIEFELMLPGVNLPFDEISYYVISMGICSIVHEMGHAFAAVLEDVPLTGFGFNILLVLPVAYTHINSDQINSLRTWRRLRILCAGIWHNIVLAGICFLLMSLLPILFTPFYSIDASVVVTSIKRNSPLAGERGVGVGDVITSINDCDVNNIDTWYGCLIQTIKHPPSYCIRSEYVLDHDESVPVSHTNDGVIECCDRQNEKNLCFEYTNEDGSYSLIELPQFLCLNIRNTMDHSTGYCHRTRAKCKDGYCIKPMMNNATTLMQIKRMSANDVMYIGHPSDLAYTIKVSPYVPKTRVLNSNVADAIALILKYLVVFSLGLATLNVIPCFYFDGYHITSVTVNHLFQRIVPERNRRECITIAITSIGTLFLFVTLSKSVWHSMLQYAF